VKIVVVVSTLLAMTCGSSSAHAQRLEVDEVDQRLRFLRSALERDEIPSARWRWGWSVVFGGLVAGNVTRALISHAIASNDAPAGWIAAAGSTLGLLNMLVIAPKGQYAAAFFRSALSDAALTRVERLRRGERLLREVAKNQDFTTSVASQAIRTAVPIAMGFALEFGFRLPIAAVLNVTGGIFIGQITIRTSPTSAIDAWNRYVTRWPDASEGPIPAGRAPFGSVSIALRPDGMIVSGVF
jgi:hypothetical protein